ncbi:MAG: 50S ribosomal protein L9 [Patescibacteria group bacterium]|nr:50S ribosomal protein L9 [Patescibacteria group bacterium]
MKVILLRGIKKLGVAGEVKDVADGYARNFLLPNSLVKIATARTLAEIEMRARTKEIRKSKNKKEQNKLAHGLQEINLEVPMKMGEKNKLYGSVTSQIISQTLQSSGYKIPDKQIIIPKPIKRLGEHSANIKLSGKDVVLNLNVVAMK